ncbi:MAG: insulinase family protein [Pseudomonadales bacterium]|nr:insulinase family protein [Pseudomonadales bacterium]
MSSFSSNFSNPASQQQCHPSFQWLRTEAIESLHVLVSEYRHKATGAMHYHIAADNDENVFMVALRTVPTDSTGVAHILEHTALCGSQKYPVRDPFFMMIRRSLNTFMNAFTASDWTAYPFASKNRKDFDNLLSVYLDAVFFSRLDELDFAQEGHRLEFAEANNPESELVYKGVVYNEMKGAMSSPASVLYDQLGRYLFPTSTYHYNSGGDPETIPDLSYEQLKAFYQTHYHPSNAIFMTFGDISAQQHQTDFEERALNQFQALDRTIRVTDEKRYGAPLRIDTAYGTELDEGDSIHNKTHIVLGWLLGESTDLESQLKAHLMTDVLLDNSAAPLRKLLETCGLGSSPSPLCGLEDSNREMAFMCGLEGSSPEKAEEFEQQVLAVLTQVAEQGVSPSRLEAALHQLELSQREIGGDHYPYGLQLMMGAISTAMHRGDPIALLNLDPVLDKMREQIKQPGFIQSLIKELLLDNPHRVRVVMRPDEQLEANRDKQTKKQLEKIKAALSEQQKQQIVDQAAALEQRQQQEEDESVLPKVGLEDVPAAIPMPAFSKHELASGDHTLYARGTNGLVYQQVLYDLPELSQEQLQMLPLVTRLVGELGAGNDDYLTIQDRLSAISGGVYGFSVLKGTINNEQDVKGLLAFSGKALKRNGQALSDLMHQIIEQPRYDELEHLRELVAQQRARLDQSITGQGHSLAMMAACSGMNASAHLSHQVGGLAGICAIKDLDHRLNDANNLTSLGEHLQSLSDTVKQGKRQFLVVAEQDTTESIMQYQDTLWGQQTPSSQGTLSLAAVREQVSQAWLTSTQVNFCAKAFPTVPADHPDSPVLSVLGGYLRNGFLHRAIREQGGAYGGGASQDPNIAAFRFYSYRDPRLQGTLTDFDESIEWLLGKDHGYQPLEEAILGVIGTLDKPGSPAGEAKQAFQNRLFGRDDAFQKRFRERVLATTEADLKRVAQTYLKPELASTAVISHKPAWDEAKLDGFDLFHV